MVLDLTLLQFYTNKCDLRLDTKAAYDRFYLVNHSSANCFVQLTEATDPGVVFFIRL